MKMKKLVALALASAMVLTSAITVSAATVVLDETVDSPTFWGAHTTGMKLSEEWQTLSCTSTSYETAAANWNTPFMVAYYGTEAKVNGAGYEELFVNRSDMFGWVAGNGDTNVGLPEGYTYEVLSAPADDAAWAAWLAANKEGVTVTVSTCIEDGKAIFIMSNSGAVSKTTIAVDTTKDVYVSLGGEMCTMKNVVAESGNPVSDVKIVSDSDSVFYTDTLQLTAEVTHKYDPYVPCEPYEVKWSSSDASIAKVTDAGLVKPLLDPEESESEVVTITASIVDPATSEEICAVEKEITVTATWVALESITIAADKTELNVGDSVKVTATRNPATTTNSSAAVYSSSDKSVIIVDSATGEVYAAGAGTATVTATVTNAKDGEIKSNALSFTVAAPVVDDGTDDGENGDDATGEDDTPAAPEGSETMTCPGWWKVFSQSWDIAEQDYEITFTTTNEGNANWNNAIFVLFYSDDGVMPADDADARAAVNYEEFWVGRLDAFGWGPEGTEGTFTPAAEDTDWDAFLAATQAGAPVTLSASVADGIATVVSSCAGVEYTTTVPVDASKPVYLCLGGELCTLSDLVVNGEATLFGGSADGAQVGDTTTPDASTGDDTKGDKAPATSDAAPIIPVALALFGCAAVVVAKKKLA